MPLVIDTLTVIMHLTTLILLAIVSVRVARNLRFLSNIQSTNTQNEILPFVSVLIPARNEGNNIAQCLESLAQQDYPQFEILILDDQSTDDTYAIIEALDTQYAHVHAIKGEDSPKANWNGKSFACHRLAERAKGDWLLFTDADTFHYPDSIRRGVEQANNLNAQLLSVMPYQQTESIGERIFVSFIMDFLPFIGIDFQKLTQPNNNDVVGNGQYVLVNTEAYRKVGGHQAVIHALVDDFALAQQFVQNNQRIAFINGTAMVMCRMYQSSRDVWDGFTKNMMLALQTNRRWPWWGVIAFAWGFVALFTAPYWAFITESNKLLPAIEIVWLTTLRLIAGNAFSRPILEAFYTPISALGVMALGLNTLYLRLLKRPVAWKGRSYNIND